uniref:Uncharacterized protein n=1 Tax=Parascaris equorum TaxID=6256 RepID=A0A914S6J6_PAREQ
MTSEPAAHAAAWFKLAGSDIELTTLENTVAQLERQKAEAERRLQALDNQIAQLESTGEHLKVKLQEEEARLNALRTENARSKENAAVSSV